MRNVEFDPFALAARKYRKYPGDPERVYRALCYALSDRIGQVDWDAFGDDDWRIIHPMAETEGVAPLLYWKLKHWLEMGQGAAHAKLPHLVERLAPAYYETLARNTVLLQELERILAAFEKAGIAVIVLKGAALAQTVYEDIGLRPMSDIDLLVRPEDVWRATHLLQRLEYVREKITFHVCLRQPSERKIAVEIHWTTVPDKDGVAPSVAWLWEHSRRHFLAPMAEFMYLIGHLMVQTQPRSRRLLWFHDLYRLYMRWPELQTGVWREAPCWQPRIAAFLLQTQILFALPISGGRTLGSDIELESEGGRQMVNRYTRFAWRHLDPLSRLRALASLVFPHKTYLIWRYRIHPVWLWPLYLPRRWGEMGLALVLGRSARRSGVA